MTPSRARTPGTAPRFFQTRPSWGAANNYFGEKAGQPEARHRTTCRAAAVGGPIVKNKTFFWFAAEGYKTPDARRHRADADRGERARRFLGADQRRPASAVTIYDPLTRAAVPGQRHPGQPDQPGRRGDREVPAAAGTNISTTAAPNYTRTALINDSRAQYTVKVEHKFSDKVSLTGFYLYNHTDEPCSNYFGIGSERREPLRRSRTTTSEAPAADRRINNTWMLSDSSVLALRYGWTQFPDNTTLTHRLRSGDARLLAELRQPDRRTEVPADPHRGYDTRRLHASARSTDRDRTYNRRRQRELLEVRRHAHVQDGRRLPPDRRRLLQPGQRQRLLRVRQGIHLVDRRSTRTARPTATRSRASCSAIRPRTPRARAR